MYLDALGPVADEIRRVWSMNFGESVLKHGADTRRWTCRSRTASRSRFDAILLFVTSASGPISSTFEPSVLSTEWALAAASVLFWADGWSGRTFGEARADADSQ
ncbi:hypothetical protein HPB50_017326 [Hyalomma asiaticum]|uniref:Uncharacterized protein n=1 Tax=Hyalomma asiaticum TaxID=266040 RepID=A0ACB7S5V9_HYAAI|nr:hypothetical protein HPB50_017326 [Hyalomma asiaticum]